MTALLNFSSFNSINEAFGKDTYKDEVDNHGKMRNFYVYHTDPKGKYANLEDVKGTVEFDMDFVYKRSGIEDVNIGRMDFALTMEVLNDDDEIEEIEVEYTVTNPDDFEVGSFPLYLSDIELDMKKSDDPKNWKISFKLGNFEK
jgi:hypothetical protein